MALPAIRPIVRRERPVLRVVRQPAPKRSTMAMRRRRTLAVLFTMLVVALVLFFPRAVQTQSYSGSSTPITYTVDAGDSLWSIAAQFAGKGDVRELIHQIKQVNGLQSVNIEPGQELLIPVAQGSRLAGR